MGAIVMLLDACSWAVAGTIITAKLARVDFLSIATSRSVFGFLFVFPAMFVLGAQADLWGMSFHTMWQLVVGGLVAYVLAEPGYVLSLGLLGLTRGYTVVIGLFSLFSYVFPAVFLGEPIGLQEALGGVVIIVGVYIVALYGRRRPLRVGEERGEPLASSGDHGPRCRRWLSRSRRRSGGGLRPISGGSGLTEAVAPGPSSSVRIPGTPIRLSRILLGSLVALLTAIAWAGDTTLLRAIADPFDASAVAVIQIAPGALVIALVLLVIRRGRVFQGAFTPRAGLVLGLTGAATTGLGTILLVFAIGEIGPGPVAVLFAMSTIFAMPLSAIVLKERVTIWGVLGAAVAVGGVALLAL
ncbi:MAG: EamA family transporter [Chloroflexi bacterium]|nr:EamA family transporter [Chloroflexota bacterium]